MFTQETYIFDLSTIFDNVPLPSPCAMPWRPEIGMGDELVKTPSADVFHPGVITFAVFCSALAWMFFALQCVTRPTRSVSKVVAPALCTDTSIVIRK